MKGGSGRNVMIVPGGGARRRAAPALAAAVAAAASMFACGGDAVPADSARGAGNAEVAAHRASSEALPERVGIGRPASDAEIAALDIDVRPDGAGLPSGRGTVIGGEEVYAARCAACHGIELEGTPIGDRLVPHPEYTMFPDSDVPIGARTIGNYWPYATTIFDYVRRAMPYDRPGSLSDEEVYAVTAYLLWRNGIIRSDAVLDAKSLPEVMMPARERFVDDDRLESDRVR